MSDQQTELATFPSKRPKEQPEYKLNIQENYIETLSPADVNEKVDQILKGLKKIKQLINPTGQKLLSLDESAKQMFNKQFKDMAQALDFIRAIDFR